MRLNRGVRTLVAVAGLAAATAPAAHASAVAEGGSGLPPTAPHVAPAQRDPSSTDWSLIAIAGGGAIVLVGAGVGGSRAHSRRRTATSDVKAARVS
jgi:hypothetical protein